MKEDPDDLKVCSGLGSPSGFLDIRKLLLGPAVPDGGQLHLVQEVLLSQHSQSEELHAASTHQHPDRSSTQVLLVLVSLRAYVVTAVTF